MSLATWRGAGPAGMRQRETGVGGDGAIERRDRAGVERQHEVAALEIGVPGRR